MSDSASEPPRSDPPARRKRRPEPERASSPRRRRADGEAPTRRHRRSEGAKPKAKARKRRQAARARPQPPPVPTGWRNPRVRLAGSAIVLIAGLALVSVGPSELGAGLTLLGALAFFYSIHRYGRLGPDPGGEAP